MGAHRGRRTRGRAWIVFAWAALATGVLVAGGVYGLTRTVPGFSLFPGVSETASPGEGGGQKAVAPITDPKAVPADLRLGITILNGSSASLAETVGQKLTAQGWPVEGTADASPRTAKTTVVYYSSRAAEGVARGMVQELGVGQVTLSDVYPSPITIVLGADYTG
ncbi:MAG: LytR C-terminal domain-containing protein [Micrococcales bacterium]|nr:LytR C-terminal domain-containing protein [Micrococcales bacterium]